MIPVPDADGVCDLVPVIGEAFYIFVRFKDSGGVTRGSTSVAAETQ